MSEQVQSIVETVRSLDLAQRRELTAALLAIETCDPDEIISRAERVDSIKGKYRHVPTSSESFISRKKEDSSAEPGL